MRESRIRGDHGRSGDRWGWGHGLFVGALIGMATLYWLRLGAADSAAAAAPTSPGVGLPVGTMMAFGGSAATVPEAAGWLLCDGRELSSKDYPELYRVLGVAWGGVPEEGRFRLPDLRGRFVRGANGGAPADGHDPEASARRSSAPGGASGDAVGSYQDDAVGYHRHALMGVGDAVGAGAAGEWIRFFATKVPDDSAPVVRNTAAVEPAEGVETRPRNVAVLWILRAR